MSWEDLGVWGDLSFAVTEISEMDLNLIYLNAHIS